jgi:hypothetical protein
LLRNTTARQLLQPPLITSSSSYLDHTASLLTKHTPNTLDNSWTILQFFPRLPKPLKPSAEKVALNQDAASKRGKGGFAVS